MIIDKELPYLSASPDMEGSCKCCGDFVVEIKCPYSICETTPTAKNLDEVNTPNASSLKLKHSHSYYTQIIHIIHTRATSSNRQNICLVFCVKSVSSLIGFTERSDFVAAGTFHADNLLVQVGFVTPLETAASIRKSIAVTWLQLPRRPAVQVQ